MSVKNDLYTILNNIGKQKLQIEFQNNMNSTIPKIKEIIGQVILMRNQKKNNVNENSEYSADYLPALCESFLHFLLTTTSLSSQRKIKIKDLEIDLVIPDLKILNQDPRKAIIIKFDKDLSTFGYTKRLHEILPIPEDNLWLVSSTPLSLPYRNYIIFKNKIDEKFNIFYNNDNDKDNNLSVISISKKIKTTNLNSDSIKNRLNVIPFYNIIVDINKFLVDTNHTGFKFLH